MKRVLPLLAATLALLSCVTTAPPQTKYAVPAPIVDTASAPWTGQTLFIDDTNGDITVQGDPATTTVTVSFSPFAYASSTADADAAVADVMTTATFVEGDFGYLARCQTASADHGSATASSTGCDIVVNVPLGSAALGMPLSVTCRSGNITLTSLVTSTTSLAWLYAANGNVTADGITGSFSAHADTGTVTASVNPTQGAVIAASADNGSASLSLPEDFSATTISVTVGSQGTLNVTGFPDAVTGEALDPAAAKIARAARMAGGPVAQAVVLYANYGTASLTPQ